MKISVATRHIEGGQRANVLYCPIGLAMAEAGVCGSVGDRTLTIYDPTLRESTTYELNYKLRHFVRKYDNGYTVFPVDFETETLKVIGHSHLNLDPTDEES